MIAAPSFDCADCGRTIAKARPLARRSEKSFRSPRHFVLTDGRVVCIHHEAEHYLAGEIAHGFCTREVDLANLPDLRAAAAARLKGVWP